MCDLTAFFAGAGVMALWALAFTVRRNWRKIMEALRG